MYLGTLTPQDASDWCLTMHMIWLKVLCFSPREDRFRAPKVYPNWPYHVSWVELLVNHEGPELFLKQWLNLLPVDRLAPSHSAVLGSSVSRTVDR